ncbi:MAG: HlyC/CorC family transporter [Thiothrix sp.]|nr:HlyC/CorC family transporter [Thiothrix sp.]HPQ96464.1 hemolysin family protein [Thiolinea sp.]
MDNIALSLVAIVLLLFINGFFVAAEFALVKLKVVRLEQLANQGSRAARLTRSIHQNLESYLAACQLGITMASLGLGWVGEPAVAALLEPLFHELGMSPEMLSTTAFLLGFLIFSSLHIVVGEQVPKTFAIRKPEPVSIWVAYPLHGFYLLAWPLNRLLSLSTSAILGFFGVEEASHADVMTGEELRGMIEVSGEHGVLEADRAVMLDNLFDFDERTVEEVMVARKEVDVLDVQRPPDVNIQMIHRTSHSRFPVVDGEPDRLLGFVLTKDLFLAMVEGVERPWENLTRYVREALVVPETLPVARLFESMRTQQQHMAFVVDEYGSFAGLVTMEDLLEEIVGEIADETDLMVSEYPIVELEPGRWEAHGLYSLSDLERVTDIDVPDGTDANTLSGLFMLELQRMPMVGDVIRVGGFRMEVLETRSHRVERALIESPQWQADTEADAAGSLSGDTGSE